MDRTTKSLSEPASGASRLAWVQESRIAASAVPRGGRPTESLIVAVMAKKPATAKMTAMLARPLKGAMTNATPYDNGATRYWRVMVFACWSVTARPRRRRPAVQYHQRPFHTIASTKNVPAYNVAATFASDRRT